MTHLPEVRAAIVKAVPEIEVRNSSVLIPAPFGGIINHRDSTIRLADVLRAIDFHCSDWMDEEGSAIVITQHGGMWDLKDATVENNWTDYPYVGHWNLAADSLDDQSPETIAFLHSVLCV